MNGDAPTTKNAVSKTDRVLDYLTAQYLDARFYNLDNEKEMAGWYLDAIVFIADCAAPPTEEYAAC